MADQLMTRFAGDVGGVTTSETRPRARPRHEAFLVTTEESPPEATLTRPRPGRPRAGASSAPTELELPSATVPGGRTVDVDAAGREMGVITPDGGAQVPLGAASPGAPTGHLMTAVKEAGKPTVTTFAIVLPIEAGDIAVRVAPGATLVSEDERPLSGGVGRGVAVVATVEGPDEPHPGGHRG